MNEQEKFYEFLNSVIEVIKHIVYIGIILFVFIIFIFIILFIVEIY